MKTLVTAAFLAALCASASADKTTTPPPAPPPAQPSLHLQLGVKQGAESRTYELVVEPASCGFVSSKIPDREDKIRVCAEQTNAGVRLKVDWSLWSKQIEYRTEWASVVQRGTTIEVGQSNAVRFTLQAS